MVPSTSSEQKNNPRFFSLSTKKICGKFWKSTQKLVENGIRLPYSNDAKDLIDILLREGAQLYEEGQKLNANLNGMEQQKESMQQAHCGICILNTIELSEQLSNNGTKFYKYMVLIELVFGQR